MSRNVNFKFDIGQTVYYKGKKMNVVSLSHDIVGTYYRCLYDSHTTRTFRENDLSDTQFSIKPGDIVTFKDDCDKNLEFRGVSVIVEEVDADGSIYIGNGTDYAPQRFTFFDEQQ